MAYFYFPNGAMMSVRRLNLPSNARILDVGCGSGHLLLDLKHLGFRNLAGADPFIQQDIHYDGGLTVYKKDVKEMTGEYDLIMLHHSFEHMSGPIQILQAIARLLSPSGNAIIRIPTASSFGWRNYGVNWVHLDAPRHLFLHTYKSIDILAELGGLKVVDTVQEADDGSFWASEAYTRDIPMSDPRFPNSTTLKKVLAWNQTLRYRARARELNDRKEADSVCFHLVRRSPVG
jgi:SAM-dependent methyltransferase